MAAAKYQYQNGLELSEQYLEIPHSSRLDFDSCYIFALAKSGSVFLNAIVTDLMKEVGVPVIDMPAHLFRSGIDLDTTIIDQTSLFVPKGYCYAGFRHLPLNMRGNLNRLPGQKVLLIRDPRDMIVSWYYSMKFSHYFPLEGTAQFLTKVAGLRMAAAASLDQFCISKMHYHMNTIEGFNEVLSDPHVHVVRYEDIIFDKLSLARRLCEWLSLDIKPERLKEIVAPHDIAPDEERPHDHIRQVKPGDHKRKLQPETIQVLNVAFGAFLAKFGYAV